MAEPIYVQTTDTLEIQRTKINDLVDWKADIDTANSILLPAQEPQMYLSDPITIDMDTTGDVFDLDFTNISLGQGSVIMINLTSGTAELESFINDTSPVGTRVDILFTEYFKISLGTGNIYRPLGGTTLIVNAGEILSFRLTAADYWEIVGSSEPTNLPMAIGGPGTISGTPSFFMDLSPGQKYFKDGDFSVLKGFWQGTDVFFQRGMTIILEITGSGSPTIEHMTGGGSGNLELPNQIHLLVNPGDILEFMLVDHTNNIWRLVGSNKQISTTVGVGSGGNTSAFSVTQNVETELPTNAPNGAEFYSQGSVIVNGPSDNFVTVSSVARFRAYAGVQWDIQNPTGIRSWRWLYLDYYDGAGSFIRRFTVAQPSYPVNADEKTFGQHIVTPPLDGSINSGARVKASIMHEHSTTLDCLKGFVAIEIIEY